MPRHGRLFNYHHIEDRNPVDGSTSTSGLPKVDVLTVESVYEEPVNEVAAGQYIVTRRLSRNNLDALKVLEEGFQDFKEVLEEESQDPEAIACQKRHFIAWSSALAHTHYKMGPCETSIPIAATAGLSHRISKCQRVRRQLLILFCCKQCYGNDPEYYLSDYTRYESQQHFNETVIKEADRDIPPVPPKDKKVHAHRKKFFNRFAPSYFHQVEQY